MDTLQSIIGGNWCEFVFSCVMRYLAELNFLYYVVVIIVIIGLPKRSRINLYERENPESAFSTVLNAVQFILIVLYFVVLI